MPDPCHLSLAEAARAIAAGSLTSRTLVESCLERIERLDSTLRAWVVVNAEGARAQADRADAEIGDGHSRGPLHGVPYGLKDILRTAEMPTRANSRLPIDDGPEATVHRRLRDAGAILLGKLNTYEFGTGTGAVYDDLPMAPARNPWNPDHFTGGSSTGAGAAVAARMAPFAIGTDTGGSVRLPAAACGLVGLKPTYGLVPRTGMLPNCPSQDHIGPLARTAEDAGLVLQAIAGFDPADPGSATAIFTASAQSIGSPAGLTVAVVRPSHDSDPAADPAVAESFERTVATLARLGARVVERILPYSARDFRACGRIINACESFAIHRRWLDDPKAPIGSALRDKLEAAAGVSAADYLDALRWRRTLSAAVVDAMAGCDALLCLGTATTAPRLDDERGCIRFTGDSTMGPFSLSGLPALCLPTGLNPDGLPLNVQLAAPAFGEGVLIRIASALEPLVGLGDRRPSDPDRLPDRYAQPPSAPSRDGRATRLRHSMAESIARLPCPLPDTLESALVFAPDASRDQSTRSTK
ncbi:glutamyl-tRNA(Gln) amidotransferase subunit A [alpha proteobacterium BAL199]|nr:glutamyl-tRNA(Gln) amidotransferase subunit A [alpha proteobacterium BAL199]